MKRIFGVILLLAIIQVGFAQTQQGVVKTRGRMVNGVLVPGKTISNATVVLSYGNPLVSDSHGQFSFIVPSSKAYSLVSVTKQGYVLADPEYTMRSFTYSSQSPFYVVLEDENQRQADINSATRKLRNTLNAQLAKREEEIEALKQQNLLTEKEYQNCLQQLYDNQSGSERLVREMAERYVSTDYDQLDEFNRQVQMYVEEGELQKADSMIRSKGSLESRVAEYRQVVAANHAAEERLRMSKEGALKTYEELSNDYYNAYTISKLQYRWNEASRYLKERADLDTTVVGALLDYALFAHGQNQYEEAITYLNRCLELYKEKQDTFNISNSYIELGWVCHDTRNYELSEWYYKQAYSLKQLLFERDSITYRMGLATLQNNMGILYRDLQRHEECEKALFDAQRNREILLLQEPTLRNRNDLAMTECNLGNHFRDVGNYDSSEVYFLRSLKNREILFNADSSLYRADMAKVLLNMGAMYSETDYVDKQQECTQRAQYHYRTLFGQNPDAYRLLYVMLLNNIANDYYSLEDYGTSIAYYQQSLELIESANKTQDKSYTLYLSDCYSGLGLAYYQLDNFDLSLTNYRKCLVLREDLCAKYPDMFRDDFEHVCRNMAILYCAYDMYEEAVEVCNHAIELYPDDCRYYDRKGGILLLLDRDDEALEMWNLVHKLNPDFYQDYPNGTLLSIGLKKYGLIK